MHSFFLRFSIHRCVFLDRYSHFPSQINQKNHHIPPVANTMKKIKMLFLSVVLCLILIMTAMNTGGSSSRKKLLQRKHLELQTGTAAFDVQEGQQQQQLLLLHNTSPNQNPNPDTDDNNDNSSNKPTIAICAATRAKANWTTLDDSDVYRVLVPSIARSVTEADRAVFRVRLYLAVDDDDDFWIQHRDRVGRHPMNPPWLSIHVKVYPKSVASKIPFNPMMRDAYDDGSEYFMRTNDDSEFTSEGWITLAVAQLRAYSPPNVGVVGPTCGEGNQEILTHDMVHRTHLVIFEKTYYPEVFPNWFVDDWITMVYNSGGITTGGRATRMANWTVTHHNGPPRYEHANFRQVRKQYFERELRHGRRALRAYLSRLDGAETSIQPESSSRKKRRKKRK